MALAPRLDALLTFDRTDVQVAWWALVLGPLAVVLTTVGNPLWQWWRRRPLEGSFSVDTTPVTELGTRTGAGARWSGEVVTTLASPSTGDRLAALAPGLALSVTVVVLAWLGMRLLTAVAVSEPFTRRTVGALRGIAGTLLVAMLVLPAADAWREAQLATSTLVEATDAVLVLEPLWLLGVAPVARVVASVAEAFARGTRLAEDVEGLV